MTPTINDPGTRMLAGKRPGVGDEQRGSNARSPRPIAHDSANLDGDIKCPSPYHAQKLRALDIGNTVRIDRAKIRRQLKSGEFDFDLFLDELPSCCSSVPLVKLLMWLPNIGRTKANSILHELPIENVKLDVRMGELSARAKYELSAFVHRHVDGYKNSSW